MSEEVLIALISFFAGSLVSLIGVLSKYFFDYRIEKRKLELEEQQDISTVLGTSQANFIRSTRELFRWLSSFFDNPDNFRKWLLPGSTPAGDSYTLHEFARRIFDFITWGRIAQDAINSLPTDVVKERSDLQQTFGFVDLAFDPLAYGSVFSEISAHETEIEKSRLFMGHIELMADAGRRLWKDNEQNISRSAFDDLYHSSESPLTALRDFLVLLHTDQTTIVNFSMARLATLRVFLAGFLLSYSWTIAIPEPRKLVNEFQDHLHRASGTSQIIPSFTDVIPNNLKWIMLRYQCKLFRLP